MSSPNLTELVASTLRKQEKQVVDQILENNALLSEMKRNSTVRVDGGRNITENVAYAENSTIQWQGEWDTLDITPQTVVSAAEYDFKILTGTVAVSDFLRLRNSGREEIINLIDTYRSNLADSFANELGEAIYSDGTDSQKIGGLQLLVADDPTTGTVGGIDRSSWSFWRNKIYDFSTEGVAAGSTTIQLAMNTLLRRVMATANAMPTLIVADNTYFGYYESSLQTIHRINDMGRADSNFRTLDFNGKPVVYDPNAPSAHMYFLNLKHMFFKYLGDSLISQKDQRMPVNQLSSILPFVMYGNLTMDKAVVQGVMHA